MKSVLNKLFWPLRLWKRLPLWGRIYVGLMILVGVQFCIPSNIVAPFAKLDGKTVGFATVDELKSTITQQHKSLSLTIGTEKLSIDAYKTGVITDVDKTAEQLPTISMVQKLIPLGVLTHVVRRPNVSTAQHTDNAVLNGFAESLADKYSKLPADATVKIENGKFVIAKAQPGQKVTKDSIVSAIESAVKQNSRSVKVVAEPVTPAISESQFVEAQKTFDNISSQKLIVKYDQTTKEYTSQDISGWLKITQDATTYAWGITVNRDELNKKVDEWSAQYNKSAGITQVTMVDDAVTSRVVGASGRRLNGDAIYDQINAWIKKPTKEVLTLASADVAPRVAYTKTYTKSSAQLQAKLNAWVASHNGQYQVAIQELGGKGRTASYNVSQQTVMASTYKLFVAYAIYHQAENGAINLGTPVLSGMSIEQCIQKAIVYSDNDCAIALGKYVGWANADNIVAAAGFKNVHLNNYDSSGNLNGDKYVNANELAKFLAQLSGGSLMNGANTSHLLGYMKSQVYRSGIPAGSHGAVVADKVGFLDNYLHDAAIVYAPGSTYALVIMSSGSSWNSISSLADAVYTFMAE